MPALGTWYSGMLSRENRGDCHGQASLQAVSLQHAPSRLRYYAGTTLKWSDTLAV